MPFAVSPELQFVGKRKSGLWVSLGFVLLSLALIFTRGLNFGVDFSGGLLIEARFQQDVKAQDLRDLFASEGGSVTVQTIGGGRDLLLRAPVNEEQSGVAKDEAMRMQNVIAAAYPDTEFLKAEYVGPKVGKELIRNGAIAVLTAFFMMLVYIWLRFEWQYGLGAIIALVHDTITALGFFALTQIEFNLASVAALLTIIGYSINDSVVIFDRIRYNFRRFKKSDPLMLINKSIRENISRTLLTSLTTMLALTALVLFGGHTLAGFSAVALFGVVIGTHSSIFLAAPLLAFMRLRHEEEPGAL